MWFRRDLRLHDNPALLAALADPPTSAVFVIDPSLWNPASRRRRAYLADSLVRLDEQIRGIAGPGLKLLMGEPSDCLGRLVADIAGGPTVHVTADFGPYAGRRDDRSATRLPLREHSSPYVHPPGAVTKSDGTDYRVFTPFHKAWQALAVAEPRSAPSGWPVGTDPEAPLDRRRLAHLIEHGLPAAAGGDLATVPTGGRGEPGPTFSGDGVAAGEIEALRRWRSYRSDGMAHYSTTRDRPDVDGTSHLGTALHYGEISPRLIVAESAGRPGAEPFIRQLCWRDFYGHLLAARPESARQNLRPEFDRLAWATGEEADRHFAAWAAGRTGYPFVDAGMRHLAQTGHLPNRLRMVVASFLVKDLHIHWRRGARHFMHHLLDADLANNQQGWQWVAGSGTDAAPYFRIFNPVAQGEKFDPAGDYVRRWVPELRHLPGAAIHSPWKLPDPPADYPDRIVDHAEERVRALELYDEVKASRQETA